MNILIITSYSKIFHQFGKITKVMRVDLIECSWGAPSSEILYSGNWNPCIY